MDTPNHQNYDALCSDPAPNGQGEDRDEEIARRSQRWSMGVPNPPTAEDLLEDALMGVGSRMDGGIGVFVEEANPPGGVLKVELESPP